MNFVTKATTKTVPYTRQYITTLCARVLLDQASTFFLDPSYLMAYLSFLTKVFLSLDICNLLEEQDELTSAAALLPHRMPAHRLANSMIVYSCETTQKKIKHVAVSLQMCQHKSLPSTYVTVGINKG